MVASGAGDGRLPARSAMAAGSAGTSVDAGARPTIVFLHSTRLTSAQWAGQVAALADSFHCLAPDLPGHGSAAHIPFTIDGAAARVAQLIELEAHGGRAILVGLSLGGYVAMAVAARCPERVAGLILSGATAEPVGPRAILYRGLATLFARVPVRYLEAANRKFFGWRYAPAVHAPILADGFFFAGGAHALRSLVGERFKPRLAAYPGPSLILNVRYDLFFRATERSFALVAANPSRVQIPGASHLANLARPEAFTAAIRRFAQSIEAP
jgi:pimeloyl-ACP methyl ester carboxylesterase